MCNEVCLFIPFCFPVSDVRAVGASDEVLLAKDAIGLMLGPCVFPQSNRCSMETEYVRVYRN